jgi:hypothetical protein
MDKSSEAIGVERGLSGTGVVSIAAASGSMPFEPRQEEIAHRIRNEYLEMPGLSLTVMQAERLWQLRRSECEHLLAALVASGFLSRTTRGAFVRGDSGSAGA